VYYSEVATMPELDLESLDRLWVCFSPGPLWLFGAGEAAG
jgi:hypothetical protein